jgi:hypothetical protein
VENTAKKVGKDIRAWSILNDTKLFIFLDVQKQIYNKSLLIYKSLVSISSINLIKFEHFRMNKKIKN